MNDLELDPRWDWVEVRTLGSTGSQWIRGQCRHADVVPVESVAGDIVAQLCMTCDEQLPGGVG